MIFGLVPRFLPGDAQFRKFRAQHRQGFFHEEARQIERGISILLAPSERRAR
jgi:hypothetical protein